MSYLDYYMVYINSFLNFSQITYLNYNIISQIIDYVKNVDIEYV